MQEGGRRRDIGSALCEGARQRDPFDVDRGGHIGREQVVSGAAHRRGCRDRPVHHQLPALVRRLGAVTVGGTTIGGSKNFSLWEAENPLDIYLLIVILVALVPAVLAPVGRWRRCADGVDGDGAARRRRHAADPLPGVRHARRCRQEDRPLPWPDRMRRRSLSAATCPCRRTSGREVLRCEGAPSARGATRSALRLGELVGAVSGLGLLVVSFLPWYSAGGENATAWQAFGVDRPGDGGRRDRRRSRGDRGAPPACRSAIRSRAPP